MLETLSPTRRRNDVAEAPARLSTADAGSSAAPHRQPIESVVSALESDTTRGLSGPEAKRRLEQYGPNQLKSAPETPWWRRVIEQFHNFLVIILLVATVISGIEWLLQDPRETALPLSSPDR